MAADVLEMMAPERQVQVIDELDESRAVRILAEAAPDHVADILGRLPFETARYLLQKLPRRRATMVSDLLQYPPGTAGGIMTNDVVIVPRDLNVAEAIEQIRPRLAAPDLVYYVYVVEDLDSQGLSGIVTLRDLLLATPDQPLTEVMNDALVTASPLEAATAVAYRLADYQLNALPVIDDNRRLLGVVTIDKAISQIAPETLRQDLPRVFA
jgi:Mg/Co/Ni transporter MgtE